MASSRRWSRSRERMVWTLLREVCSASASMPSSQSLRKPRIKTILDCSLSAGWRATLSVSSSSSSRREKRASGQLLGNVGDDVLQLSARITYLVQAVLPAERNAAAARNLRRRFVAGLLAAQAHAQPPAGIVHLVDNHTRCPAQEAIRVFHAVQALPDRDQRFLRAVFGQVVQLGAVTHLVIGDLVQVTAQHLKGLNLRRAARPACIV